MKETAKVSSLLGKSVAQDLGRSSLDGENSPAAEVGVELPSPFYRTNWVSQHRQKFSEVVMTWAVLRGEAWVVPGGRGMWRVSGGSRVN